jgi:single-stranded-DNA-specific exonuclease
MEVDLADLKPSVLQNLRQFEPYGPGAKAPVFLARNLRHAFKLRLVGKDERHLRVGLGSDTTPYPVEAIAFNFGEDFQRWNNCERFTAVFNVQSETYRGEVKPRVAIEAWWPEGEE